MTREENIKELLAYILWVIAEATESMEIDSAGYRTFHFPILRYSLVFEFTDEDIQLIKSLGEEMKKDFLTLTES